MISTEFAPNEEWDDALLSFSLLFQPWRWRYGPELNEVKNKLAELLEEQPENIFLLLSGRAGLHHVVQSLELKPGSKALVCGFTCEAVVLPLIANNITPIYNDVSEIDYSSNLNSTTPNISRDIKLLLIQHTFGIPPLGSHQFLKNQHGGLVVIEDMAHGFQKKQFYENSVNSIKLLSFGRSKSLSSVFGGAVVINTEQLRSNMEAALKGLNDVSISYLLKLLNYKWLSVLIKSTYSFLGLGRALHRICISLNLLVPEISVKEKMGEYDPQFDKAYPNALAILLLHQLKKYKRISKRRQLAVKIYREALKGKLKDDYSLARYPVLIQNREALLKVGREYGVYFGKWYTQPVAPAGLELSKVAYKKGSCPVSEHICDHILNLPTNVSEETARDIAAIVKPYILKD